MKKINLGTTYLVASSPNNTAFVEITDDDSLPLLAILNPTSPIVESAGQVIFGIETTMFPSSAVKRTVSCLRSCFRQLLRC